MKKKELETAEAIEAQKQPLSEAIVTRQYALQPEIWGAYGKEGREKSLRDVEYHLSYLVESIRSNDFSLFVHYVEWLKSLFEGLKFPEDVLPVMLDTMREVMRERLSEEMSAVVNKHMEAVSSKLPEQRPSHSPFISVDRPMGSLAKKYLDALLLGDKQRATQLIMDFFHGGGGIKNIYLQVFQPVQREIGRLWQMNEASVAQEHYASAATQLIMSQLYPHIFSTEKKERRLVAACVSKELHEIGIRMVSDIFELSGWDTYYLGANLPPSSVIQAINEYKADILALSCTIPVHQRELEKMIAQVRSEQLGRDIKIIVGGYSLNTFRDAWKRSGADGFAPDAEEAVLLANRLLSSRSEKT
jgi:methanogenic corrinoid protein MtbC1